MNSPDSRIALLAFVQLCLAMPADATQFTPLIGREYREVYNPTNPVRGEAVVGIAIVPRDGGRPGRTIEVWLPESFLGELQVEAATANGRYRGEGVYTGSSAGNRWVPLALTPQSGGKTPLPGDSTTLAVAVRGPGQTFFVARWPSPPGGSAQSLRLYVNSRRADMFVRAGKTVVRCSPLTITQPLRFDNYCDVAISALPQDGQLVLIRRDQSDEQTQTITVNVRDLR